MRIRLWVNLPDLLSAEKIAVPCPDFVGNSIGIVTALNPYIGYENSTRIAKRALETNRSVMELVLEEGLLNKDQLEDILSPQQMIRPRV